MCNFRYLMHIAYIGKPFRGAQRQVVGVLPRQDDLLTVQGRLEMALKRLNPINEPIIYLSSRTDAGVHALNTTCHVDLARSTGTAYEPRSISICLNSYFKKQDVPIRIIKTYLVPETFHSRHNAISRTYLYRITVGKSNTLNCAPNFQFIPIEDWDRSLFYCTNSFNLEAMREGAKLFEGLHDFRTFMGKSEKIGLLKVTRRVLDYIIIEQAEKTGYSPYSWPNFLNSPVDDYLFINVYIKSPGFLYRQVRRIVAALVALAQGKVSLRDIKLMLEIPSRHSWCPQIKTLPAHGLYLCEVEYSKEDLDTFRTDLESF